MSESRPEIELLRSALDQRLADIGRESLKPLQCHRVGGKPRFTVEADLVVSDEKTGFCGLFKVYEVPRENGREPFRQLKLDLRCLAEEFERIRSHGRPPSIVLFAIIRNGSDLGEAFANAVRDMQDRERLLEVVGLSRLIWDEAAPEAVAWWADSRLDAETPQGKRLEVERFLAPLLLRTRRIAAANHRRDWLSQWQAAMEEALSLPDGRAKPSEPGKARSDLNRAAIEYASAKLQRRPVRGPTPPRNARWRLEKITGLRQYRRFGTGLPPEIHFGSKLTVLYGHNGVGKSSLMDAVALALAGEVRAGGKVLDRELVHKGDGDPQGRFGYLHVSVAHRDGKAALVEQEERLEIQRRPVRSKPPLDTFYMTQPSLRSFMDMAPGERFQWIAERLGLDSAWDRHLDEALAHLQEVVSPALARMEIPVARTGSGRALPLFEKAVTERITALCGLEEFAVAARRVQEAFQVVLSVSRSPQKMRPFETELRRVFEHLERVQGMAPVFQQALSTGETLGPIMNAMEHRGANLLRSVQRLEQFLPQHQVLRAQKAWENMQGTVGRRYEGPGQEEIRHKIREVESALEPIRRMRRAMEEGERYLAAASELRQRSGAELAKLEPHVQAGDYLLREIRSGVVEFERRVEPLANQDSPFQEALHRLRERERYYSRVQASFQRALHTALVQDREQSGLVETELNRELQKLFSGLGLRLPRLPAADLMGIPVTRAVLDLAERIHELTRMGIPTLDPALRGQLLHYFDAPADGKPGLYYQLFAWDYLRKKERMIRRRTDEVVKRIIVGEFGATMREILWTLTGYTWGQVDLRIDVGDGKLALETKWGAVERIYNMAEQNIVGLSLFFTGYLYAGSSWSRAILIDDPFQNLDDVNLLSFVRMFDDVASACGAEQLVLALHQVGVTEYLREHFAGEPQGRGSEFALLRVYQVSDMESTVEGLNFRFPSSGSLTCVE